MRSRCGILLVLLAAVTGAASAAEEEPLQYVVDMKFIRADKAALEQLVPGAAGDKPMSGISDENLLAKAVDLERQIRREDGEDAFEILSAPKVVTLAGHEACIVIGDSAPAYFEPAGESQPGLFAYRLAPKKPGLSVSLTVRPHEERYVKVDVVYELNMHIGRKRLEGVDLDVGPPIVATQKTSGTFVVAPGKTLFHTGQSSDGAYSVLLLSVKEWDAAATPDAAFAKPPLAMHLRAYRMPEDAVNDRISDWHTMPNAVVLAGEGRIFLADITGFDEASPLLGQTPPVLLTTEPPCDLPHDPKNYPEIFRPIDGEKAVPWTRIEDTEVFSCPARVTVGETEVKTTQYQKVGTRIGLFAEPPSNDGTVLLEVAILGEYLQSEEMRPAGAWPLAMDTAQARMRAPVKLGDWTAFITPIADTGDNVMVLVQLEQRVLGE